MFVKLKKTFLVSMATCLLLLPIYGVSAINLLNQEVVNKGIRAQDDTFQASAGFAETTDTSMAEILATVIKAFIGLLGIIFVVLIVYAGYSWMTAGGDEAKITKSKETITRAIIGLVIVLAAYSITFFVFSNLDSVVSST